MRVTATAQGAQAHAGRGNAVPKLRPLARGLQWSWPQMLCNSSCSHAHIHTHHTHQSLHQHSCHQEALSLKPGKSCQGWAEAQWQLPCDMACPPLLSPRTQPPLIASTGARCQANLLSLAFSIKVASTGFSGGQKATKAYFNLEQTFF